MTNRLAKTDATALIWQKLPDQVSLNIFLFEIKNFSIHRPQIYENNGGAPGAPVVCIGEKLFTMRITNPNNASAAMYKAVQAFLIDDSL